MQVLNPGGMLLINIDGTSKDKVSSQVVNLTSKPRNIETGV
jgi:hypothetical protein